MSVTYINGAALRAMVAAGTARLEQFKAQVDALNVFPVPDGDTGTNMTLTMQAATRETVACASNALPDVAAAMSRGALKGARGNSGVILSQMLRGFASVAQSYEELGPQELAEAFTAASDMAYKALMKPKEGTILTVGRVMGESAQSSTKRGDIDSVMRTVLSSGEEILKMTPDMLPVLKQAGVVDAGGRGLIYIYEGFWQALSGELPAPALPAVTGETAPEITDIPHLENLEDIEFGYCSEATVVQMLEGVGDNEVMVLREAYGEFADSVVVVCDGEVIKIHAHSETPWRVLELAGQYGEITDIKIDNMREQNRRMVEASRIHNGPKKPLSVVAVAAGEGIKSLFADLLVDEVITGGQSMNPSIEDIAEAVIKSGGERVLILPNNPNIILAAQQAGELLEEREVFVVPTKSMTAGVAAVLAYNPDGTAEDNAAAMQEAARRVGDGQVTFAVRDTNLNGVTVKKDDIIGLANGKLAEAGACVDDVVIQLLAHLVKEESEMITLYYGESVTEEAAVLLRARVEEAYSQCDVEVVQGAQPLYYYFVAVE